MAELMPGYYLCDVGGRERLAAIYRQVVFFDGKQFRYHHHHKDWIQDSVSVISGPFVPVDPGVYSQPDIEKKHLLERVAELTAKIDVNEKEYVRRREAVEKALRGH